MPPSHFVKRTAGLMIALGALFLPGADRNDHLTLAAEAQVNSDTTITTASATQGELSVYPFGTVQYSSIWVFPKDTPVKKIAVCWENPSADDIGYRNSVREAVAASWEKVSALSFTGWEACTNNRGKEAIRIRIADEGPHVKALGNYLDDYPAGMVLNFQFTKWSPDCQQKVDFCARVLAVHEFGHAIGFAHEQNRADAPFECQAERQGTNGDWNVTTYDPKSVMNYCNTLWNNDGLLSARDVQGVTYIYGTRS